MRGSLAQIAPGQSFGRLTAVEPITKGKWRFRCGCGTEIVRWGSVVAKGKGNTQSCGCARKEATARRNRCSSTHGHTSGGRVSRTYRSWAAMWSRCTDPNATGYGNYGGRGIKVDPRWRSFEAFLEDMGDRPLGCSIDRRDNNGNYCKDNCRWATATEQNRNRRSVRR